MAVRPTIAMPEYRALRAPRPEAALDEAAVKVKEIMSKNGFYQGKDPMNFAATEPGFWMGKGKPLPF